MEVDRGKEYLFAKARSAIAALKSQKPISKGSILILF